METDTGKPSLQLCGITNCSMCLATFKKPKELSCIHTFCFRCLDSYCAKKKQEEGEEMLCPVCIKPFSIPPGGVQNLSNNVMILQMLQINKSAVTIATTASDKRTVCELCSDSEVEKTSTSHCTECNQHMCDRCAVIHTKAKVSMSHEVVRNADITSSVEGARVSADYCEQHPSERNTLYCYNCNKIMCSKCVSKHNQHKLSDVSESANEFREQIKYDADKVSADAAKKEEEIKQLKIDTDKFIEKVASTEKMISKRFDELIACVHAHKSQMMQNLEEFKENVLKEIRNRKDKIERHIEIMESFNRYCLEMNANGTTNDICHAGQYLHARAEELGVTQDEPDCNNPSEVEITFKQSQSSTDIIKNFIGELTFAVKNKPTKLNALSFLDKSRLLRVRPDGVSGLGLTILDSQLFVVRDGSKQVNVYSTNLAFNRNITICGSSNLHAIVASPRYKCLYISDTKLNFVFRYNLIDNVISSWSVGDGCWGLSLTATQNVVITMINTKQIKEYTPDGSLVREIGRDSSIVEPLHSVQLSSGQFAVSHGYTESMHRVCLVDTSGCIIRCYGGSKGSGVGQLDTPTSLAVDGLGNILVADWGNNRVVLLNRFLSHLGYITIPGHTLNCPWSLSLHHQTRRLYIGEFTNPGRVFVLSV